MARRIVWTLLENAAIFTALFAGVWLLKVLLRRRLSAAMQAALWAVVLVKLVIPVSLTAPWSPAALIQPRPTATPPALSQPVPAIQQNMVISASLPDTSIAASATAASSVGTGSPSSTPTLPSARPDWAPIALALWLAGVTAVSVRLALASQQLRRYLRLCAAAEPPAWMTQELRRCAQELGIHRPVRLVLQSALTTPAIRGMLRPTILLPETLTDGSPVELRHVLLHELTHARRGDLEVLWLLNGLCALYWFHPLVWLCAHFMRRDMEVACDSAVVTRLDTQGRREYIGTLLRFARAQNTGSNRLGSAQAALGLGGSRARMQRRIEGMFRAHRTSRGTRATVMALSAVLLFAAFTAGCQPTPAKPAVVNKNDGKLQEKLLQTATPSPTSNAPGETIASADTLRTRMAIPERWTLERANEENTVRLHMDAAIETPDVAKAAVYGVKVAHFTIEQAQKLHQALLAGAQLYEPMQFTKEDYAQQIVGTKAEIADAKEHKDDLLLEKFESSLEYLQEEYGKAPEHAEKIPGTLAFKDNLYGEGSQDIQLFAAVDGRDMLLSVSNSGVFASASVGITQDGGRDSRWYNQSVSATPKGVTLTREQAVERARSVVAQIDPSMEPDAVTVGESAESDGSQAWLVSFARSVGGMLSSDGTHSLDERYADNNNPPYEALTVGVDDSGIVGFVWGSPLEITETVNADVALMPYDEIKEKAEDQLYRYSLGLFDIYRKASKYLDVKVEHCTLRLTRMARKDSPGEYLLVPAWDFYGKVLPDTSGYPEKKKRNAPPEKDIPLRCLLTINAIDGSVIDIRKGY